MSRSSFKTLFRLFLRNWFIVFFILGLFTGYGIVQFSGLPYVAPQSAETSAGQSEAVSYSQSGSDRSALFISVIRHRLPRFVLLLICGATSAAAPVYILFASYTGITQGILLSLYAMQGGLHGLVAGLSPHLPHSLCYCMAYILLFRHPWLTLPRRKRMPLLLFMFLLLFLGISLEVYTSYSLSVQ